MKPPYKLAVLAEANYKVGMGHFMRCLSLALMVKDLVEITFYARDIEQISSVSSKYSLPSEQLISNEDFLEKLDANTIALVDGYDYTQEFEKKIRQVCLSLMRIDDEYNRAIFADYIINQAPGVSREHYSSSKGAQLLLGPDYALLRPEFLNASVPENRDTRKVAVCFGGADPQNLSFKITQLLLDQAALKEVHLILGQAYLFSESLDKLLSDNRLKVYKALSAEQMVETVLACGLAIVPASGVLYECLALGTPCISGYYVPNQANLYKGWKSLNAILPGENFDVSAIVQQCHNAWYKNAIERLNQDIVDGKSVERYRVIFGKILNQ